VVHTPAIILVFVVSFFCDFDERARLSALDGRVLGRNPEMLASVTLHIVKYLRACFDFGKRA